jgi:hypothetical protein
VTTGTSGAGAAAAQAGTLANTGAAGPKQPTGSDAGLAGGVFAGLAALLAAAWLKRRALFGRLGR